MKVLFLTEQECRVWAEHMPIIQRYLEEGLYETQDSYPETHKDILEDQKAINKLARRLEELK